MSFRRCNEAGGGSFPSWSHQFCDHIPPRWWSSSSMQSYLVPLGNKPCSSFSLPELSPACSLSLWFLLIVYKSIQVKERGRACRYAYVCAPGIEVGGNIGAGWRGRWGGSVVWRTTCPYTWIILSSNETLWAGSDACLQAPDYAAICRICLRSLLRHISYSQNPICFNSLPFSQLFLLSFSSGFSDSTPKPTSIDWGCYIIYDKSV